MCTSHKSITKLLWPVHEELNIEIASNLTLSPHLSFFLFFITSQINLNSNHTT